VKPLDKHEQLLARTLEIERAVLGGILVDPERYHDAREHVTDADFFRKAHQIIFAGLTRLVAKQQPIDVALLIQELTAEELDIADLSYLGGLVDGVPRAMNVTYYAREVAEKATLRALEQTAQRILTAAQTADDDASEILADAERAILGIRDRSTTIDVVAPATRAASAHRQIGDIIAAEGALQGVPTGLRDLDQDLLGLRRGDLITVAARPSMGKTSLAQHLAIAAGQAAGNALFFSLEMSAAQLNLREVTTRACVNSWRLQHGKSNEWEQRRLGEALDAMADSRVYVVDAPSMTVGKMSAISRRMKAQHGLVAILVDYLQLIVPERRRDERSENRTVEIGVMTRSLKGLARDLDVPLVLLSQLSRGPEMRPDKRPQLSDLRESGAIEQDSDVVLLLHRPNAYPDIRAKDQYPDHYAEINLAKQRNGPTGIVKVAYYREYTAFGDYHEEPQTMPTRATAPELPLEASAS